MEWEDAEDYAAMIGGVLYRNVRNPVVVNGKPLIALSRNRLSKMLGVSLYLEAENGTLIAKITNNQVELCSDDFVIATGERRISVIRKSGGQVHLDLNYGVEGQEFELELSALIICSGYPIVLHPERTKLGLFNDAAAPNIARLTLTTEKGSKAGAIQLTNAKLYLLGLCIENFQSGVNVIVENGHVDN